MSNATAPVTENLTTTASHCPSNAVIQPDPKDPGGTAGEATGLVLDLAQCSAEDALGLVPPVPCVDGDCPDPGDTCRNVYKLLGDLGIYRTAGATDCIPDPSTEPCDYVPCGPPPVPDHCNYVDCRIIDGFLNGGGSGDFEANENKICDAGDPHWFSDQDGDKVYDCFDNDNDGDYLTDKFEHENEGYDMNGADPDGDGSDDSLDVKPNGLDPKWTITAWDYNAPFENDACEWNFQGYPDPYLDHFTLELNNTAHATMKLQIPVGWQEDNHVDDREPGKIGDLTLNSVDGDAVVEGVYLIPNDIREFGTTELGEPPGINLRIGMWDHDHDVDEDERMDLVDGQGVKADLGVDLTQSGKKPWDKGDNSCWGKIQFAMNDNVFEKWVCTALYHYQNPDEMIYTGTNTSC